MGKIDLRGLDKAAVLAALYNNARPMGMGVFQSRPGGMTAEEARALLTSDKNPDYPGPRQGDYFDYLYGRPLKIDLGKDELEPRLYDRDHGYGAAARVVAGLRAAPEQPPAGPRIPPSDLP